MRPIIASLPLLLLSGLALAAPPAGPNRMAQGFTHLQQTEQRQRLQRQTMLQLNPALRGNVKKPTDALTRQMQLRRRQMQGAYYLQQQLRSPAAQAPAQPQIKLEAPKNHQLQLHSMAQHKPGFFRRIVSGLFGLFH